MSNSLLVSTKLVFQSFKNGLNYVMSLLKSLSVLIILVLLFIEFSLGQDLGSQSFYSLLHWGVISVFVIDFVLRVLLDTKPLLRRIIKRPVDIFIVGGVIAKCVWPAIPVTFFLTQVILIILLIGNIHCLEDLFRMLRVSPAKIIVFAFLFVIFIGAMLLSLPVSTTSSLPFSFIDALFTSFSAVCVTGLTVNSIGQDFSFVGQLIILSLVQIGGLGIMSFSILTVLLMKQKISPADSIRMQKSYTTYNLKDTFSAIRFIFQFTILFELIGACLLTLVWHKPGVPLETTIYNAIFHSISAFCNAGFTLFDQSLVAFQFHWPTLLIIASLIIVGGLGFPVLFNLYQRYFKKGNTPLRLHTLIALNVTFFLLIAGTVIIYFSEREFSFYGYTLVEQLQLAFFQSVTARTAGFNTIDIALFHPASIFGIMILMIIGASPVSTGGGIKTTTFGLLAMSTWNVLKSSYRFDFNKKSIHTESVLKAFATLLIALLIIMGVSIILFFTEKLPINQVMFEVVSAFGTVGLSLNATAKLSFVGKCLIMVTMFIGRIGPFVFFYTFLKQRKTKTYAYPVEKVSIV